jgi:hypothetical protein
MAGAGLAGQSLTFILLMEVRHVNRSEVKFRRGAFKIMRRRFQAKSNPACGQKTPISRDGARFNATSVPAVANPVRRLSERCR